MSWETAVLQEGEFPGPGVTHIEQVNLRGSKNEMLVSDFHQGRVRWLGNCDASGECDSEDLAGTFTNPTRTAVADMDGDGRRDVIVADIGSLFPIEEPVGTVKVLYGRSGGGFEQEDILTFIGRVVCATPADLDDDGDLDLIICEFGAETGRFLWLEQTFVGWDEHVLWETDGAMNGWAADIDDDGQDEIVASISQLEEVIVIWDRQSDGSWVRLDDPFDAPIDWFGMSGMEVGDLDEDGDLDIVVANGDSLDGDFPVGVEDPWKHYGIRWLENDDGEWIDHDILRHWGAYTPRIADLDGDCDNDIAVISLQMAETVYDRAPGTVPTEPMFWLEQTEPGVFTKHVLPEALSLPHGFALEVMDVDGDSIPDIVAAPIDLGGFHEEAEHLFMWRGVWE